MQSIFFYVIAILILATNLFQWRSAWRMYGGIQRDLVSGMWSLWRASYKSWMIALLFVANVLFVSAIITLHRLRIDFPKELLLYGLLITVSTLSWNLLPPTVLFLASSREESGQISAEMRGFLLSKGLRIAYLLDPASTAIHGDENYMDNFRTKDNLRWERAVQQFMEVVPIIAIDVRVPSAGVTRETEWVFKNTLADKTFFIVGPDGSSEVLERLFPSAQSRSLLPRCDATRVLEPLAMYVANIVRSRVPLPWER